MDKSEIAVENKHNGCNCAQAVLLAYRKELGLTDEVLLGLGAAFGSGMGRLKETCGALCGAQMVYGLKKYAGKSIGKDASRIRDEFEKLAGAANCGVLKGTSTGRILCSCDDCVKYAAQIIQKELEQ